MRGDPTNFKEAFVDLVDETYGGAGETHPTGEEIERLRFGSLAEDEAEPLREHLLVCHECMTVWRSPESARAAEPSTDFELAAFRRGLARQLEETAVLETAGSSRSSGLPVFTPAVPAPAPRFFYALAASLLLGIFGLSSWVVLQSRTLDRQERLMSELLAPRPNAAIYDLVAFEPRAGGPEKLLVVPSDAGFLLVLTPTAALEEPAYTLDFFAEDDRRVGRVEGLEKNPVDDTFSLWLPSETLVAGEYRLVLRVSGAKLAPAVEEYRLRVLPAEPRD